VKDAPAAATAAFSAAGVLLGKEDRPPKPSTGCGHCDYVWVNGRGWTPRWNMNCPVHKKPSDL
jgi:hypothetical protein